MLEIYLWKDLGVSIFIKGENKGKYFPSNNKPYLVVFKNLLSKFDKLISFSECPENLKPKILEYYPELGEVEGDEFGGYTVS